MARKPVAGLEITLLTLLLIWSTGSLGAASEQQYLETARNHAYQGNLKAAVIELKNALHHNPENAEARYLLGKLYLTLGNGVYAEKELRRAAELGVKGVEPLLAESLLQQEKYESLLDEIKVTPAMSQSEQARLKALRGDAYLLSGDVGAATRTYAQALALQADEIRALMGQARVAAREAENDKSRSLVKRVIELQPDHAEAWALLGSLERRAGDLEAAEQALGKAIEHGHIDFPYRIERALIRMEREDFARAAQDVAELEKVNAKHPSVAYLRGRLSFRDGHFEEAHTYMSKALNSRAFDIPALFYLGASQMALGQYEQAAENLSRFLHARPGSASAARLLAEARLKIGDLYGAADVLGRQLQVSPEDPELLGLMAQVKRAQGDRSAANEYLRSVASLRPDSPAIQTELGISLLREGGISTEEGIQTLEHVLEQDASAFRAEMALVVGHLQAGKYEDALKAAEVFKAKYPDNAAPWTLAGIVHGALGDLDQARSAFEQAMELMPGEPSAAANLAALALREGDVDAARGYYRQSLEHFPERLSTKLKLAKLEAATGNRERYRELLEESLAEHPKALEPHLLLARLHLAQQRPLEGIAVLRQVQDDHGNDPEYLSQLGSLEHLAGEYASAVRRFGRRVEIEPDSAEARYQLANSYAGTGNAAAFEASLMRGLQLDPDHPAVSGLISFYVTRATTPESRMARLEKLNQVLPDHPVVLSLNATLALRLGDFARAARLFSEGREGFPSESRWTIGLSQALLGLERQQEALGILDQWIVEHPNDQTVRLVLANTFLLLQRPDDARSVFEELAAAGTQNAFVLNNLAWLLRTEKPEEALEYAERAVKITGSQDPYYLDTFGTILTETGEVERGLEALQAAVEKNPTDPTIRYHYAVALDRSGKSEKAQRELQLLLSRDRDFAEKKAAQAMLERDVTSR